MKTNIGFIGLGNLGTPIAQNLIKAGYHLQVYNRTATKIDELDQSAVTKCDSPADAAKDVEFIVTVLSDDKVVREVVTGEDGILKTLPKNAIHISISTILPETSKEMAALHEQSGSCYLASPVFGRPEAAAAKLLWVCTSGKAEIKEAAKPVQESISQGIIDFGEEVGAANVVKITGNFMIQASMEMMAESYTLAEKYGVDRSQISEFFSATLFNAPIFKNYGKIISGKQYEPVGFTSQLGYKDANLAFRLSQQSQTPMPLVNIVHNRLLTALAKGWKDRDWSEAFGRGVSDDAGI
ncbi:NAD(P)-dependent oxidoreductase [Mucilaginibacter sp. KACC 22063]|uniref:NAD(P)-dependent oxidoreductase n=1 Tax=Mucilaginibacter sp. KACC 22063 TaxID=3025666 RepID=UPI002366E83A|nr:NAD(P)-dependent oxidoreductase [Mucilaginibacter sp. KACC 22063]WDF54117.1 NAD(P)-dependent oxidoreductase [Mucilaginibacter sp. KACC 22063]